MDASLVNLLSQHGLRQAKPAAAGATNSNSSNQIPTVQGSTIELVLQTLKDSKAKSSESLILQLLQKSGGQLSATAGSLPEKGPGIFLANNFFPTAKAAGFKTGTQVLLKLMSPNLFSMSAKPDAGISTSKNEKLPFIFGKQEPGTFGSLTKLNSAIRNANRTSETLGLLKAFEKPGAAQEKLPWQSLAKQIIRPLLATSLAGQSVSNNSVAPSEAIAAGAQQPGEALARLETLLAKIEGRVVGSSSSAINIRVEKIKTQILDLRAKTELLAPKGTESKESSNQVHESAEAPLLAAIRKLQQLSKAASKPEEIRQALAELHKLSSMKGRDQQATDRPQRASDGIMALSEAVRSFNSSAGSELDASLLIIPNLLTGLLSDIFVGIAQPSFNSAGQGKKKSAGGNKSLELNLQLPGMGPLSVQILSTRYSASILFETSNSESADFIDSRFELLRERLATIGFKRSRLGTRVKSKLKHGLPKLALIEQQSGTIVA